ncbi:Solute carrier family 17 (Anion/sugar transporter) member 5 [Fasciolopsis buskii]|uniref:Solute carrier family 17 (Anion/sugar transporter) member 5 n=1 Tax=Fasciolopsis buskii TaxID=27845 RepID=A0A8E0VKK5_9TREM|nr:Solute carrier family 17 (Anion/sugar transporter) member 5 [Fasciolopsis buski]
MILGVFFWGYLFGQVPLGWITQRFTVRHVVLANLLLLSASTLLLPLAAYTHLYLFCALRVVTGFTSAAWFPGFYKIWAAWAPPNERGLLVGFSYAGLHIGNAITLPISGALCRSSLGWPSVFYFFGAVSFVYAILWALLVYDTPKVHPRISQEEKRFILSQCGDPTSKRREKASPRPKYSCIPIRSILTSIPVWAFVAINVGFDWNGYTFLTSMPAYMREVLKFDIQENAGLSALPYVGLWIGQISTGWLSDRIIARRQLSVGVVRKLMTCIGTFGPGVTLITMSFLDCHLKYVVVTLFTVGLMMNSGVFSGGLLNPIEISPRHAGFIFAGSNSLSAATGFIGPIVVSALTPHKSYQEWRYVFYLGAAIYALSGLIFLVFSSSKIQPWAIDSSDPWSSGDIQVSVENRTQQDTKQTLIKQEHSEGSENQK